MRTLYTGLTPPDTDCVHTPLIEIVPVADDTALRQARHNLDSYQYLLFTSRFAVKHFFSRDEIGCVDDMALKIISIGPTTTAALECCGLKAIAQVKHDNSYGVIEWFSDKPRGRVLIPRSDLALNIIPDGLRGLGFEVDTVTAYVNRMPKSAKKTNLDEIDRIVFTSPSTIDNFISLYGSLPKGKTFVTRGPVTEQHLQNIIKEKHL